MEDAVAACRPVPLAWLVACFVLALLVRLPVLSLPLEGEGAHVATRGAVRARVEVASLDEGPARGVLLPTILAVPIRMGTTPTQALRTVDVLLGAFLAVLATLVAFRLGVPRRAAWFVGSLTAVHPLLAAHAGGAVAGTSSLVGVLFLGGLLGVASAGVRARRAGAVLAAALPLAHPLALVFGAGLLVAWFGQERSLRARVVLGGLFALALVFAPWCFKGAQTVFGTRLLAFLFQWVPLAGLVVLLPALLGGARRLLAARARSWTRLWLVTAGLTLLLTLALPVADGFAFGLDAGGAVAPLVPLVLILGVAGLDTLAAPWPRRIRGAAVGLALAGSLFAVLGPVQTFLLPGAPAAAGRLHRLARCMHAARDAAGEGGWVALALDDRLPRVEVDRLMDLAAGRRVGRLPRLGPQEDSDESLPLAELPPDTAVGIVMPYIPEVLEVTTLAGGGIYQQVPVARFGPWLVLRAIRP